LNYRRICGADDEKMDTNIQKKTQYRYETLVFAILLMFSAGVMDAYSYLCRGGVFANAQTGNIFLLFVQLAHGNFKMMFHYLGAVLSFGIGIALAFAADHFLFGKGYTQYSASRKRFLKKTILAFEGVLLAIVAFLPQSQDYLANCLTSLACGAQLEAFYRVDGLVMATTMCIGNYRSVIHETLSGRKAAALRFAAVILAFCAGAVLCSFIVVPIAQKTIIISCIVLAICIIIC